MENTVKLILEIINFNNPKYKDLNIKALTINEVIENDVLVFACALKDSDGLLEKESIVYELNDISEFKFNESKETFDNIVNEMFEEYQSISIDKCLFLCVDSRCDLTGFEKIYNDTVSIYNSMPLYSRRKFLKDNALCSEETEYKILTTYFEVLSRPNYKLIMNYLKEKGIKIDLNSKMYK